MSRVFSIELDGISNACMTKVMMKSPVTSTADSEERNSTVVSFGFSPAPFFASFFSDFVASLSSFFATGDAMVCRLAKEPIEFGPETRFRPLARRRARTALPLLVFIRVRKPCVLERRRRLG